MKIEQIIDNILTEIKDPFTQLTPKEMGLKTTLSVDGHSIKLQLRAGFPTQLLSETLIPHLEQKLALAFPGFSIQVILESFIQAHRTQLAGSSLRGVKNTIAIGSGKGGVGKSTVAVQLAISLAALGARVGILDADIYGPSVPTMLGPTETVQVEGEHYLPIKAHGVQAMSIGYLTEADEALIWRGPMLAKALIQMLDLTRWDNLDYLFIDLPPGTGDIQLSLVQKIPLTGAIIVTTPQTVATLDAHKAMKMFEKTNIDVLGIIENMSEHRCSQCGHQEALFGKGGAAHLCQQFKTTLLGQLPLDSRISAQCDQGEPVSEPAFQKAALLSAIELANRPLNYASKFPPIRVE